MREKDIEALFRKGVRELGGMALKWVSPGTNGVPDRIVILPGGRIELVELKTDTGRLSDVQKAVHRKMAKCGVEVKTLYGKEDVITYLETWRERLMKEMGLALKGEQG